MSTIIDGIAPNAMPLKPYATPAGHPESAGRPSWQSRPCPAWCEAVHSEGAVYEDRYHFAAVDPIDLSLYESTRGAQAAEPGTALVSASQHYREAEPTIAVTLPVTDGQDERRVIGETALNMTTAEARALRDRLSQILLTIDGGAQGSPDFELGESDDGAVRCSAESRIAFGGPFGSDAYVSAQLLQWTEPDSPPELEVTITGDIAQPWGCTPAQAHGVAAQLREAAGHIDALAAYAENRNAENGTEQ